MDKNEAVFVVTDFQGGVRVVGVFDSRQKAEHVVDINPNYYRIHEVLPNAVNLDVLPWLPTKEAQQKLEQLALTLSPDKS